MRVQRRQTRVGTSSPSRIRLRSIGTTLAALLVFAACTPPPANPCATSLQCGQLRDSAEAGSGDAVLVIDDSILAAYRTDPPDPPVPADPTGAASAAARVAQNGLRARVYTSVGSTFEHWNNGLIRRDELDTGPVTNETIADLNAGQTPPTSHVVLALGTNDAALIATGRRTFQQVAEEILASMNQALFTSSGCLIMVTPAVHSFTVWNPDLEAVRNGISFVAAAKNNALNQSRVHVADFHQVWVAAGSPESWLKGTTGQDPHLTDEGHERYLDLIFFYTAAAKNGSLGC